KGDANLFCHVWLTSPLSLYRQSLEGHTSLERARVIKPHSCHSQPWRPAHGHEGLLSRPSTDSYSHTTLISRPIALNSGSPVYTSIFSRFASAAAKQSNKDIFFATFNCPANSDSSWSAGTISIGKPNSLARASCH